MVSVLLFTSCSSATALTSDTSPIEIPRGSVKAPPNAASSAPIEETASFIARTKSGAAEEFLELGSLYRASSVPTIASFANMPVNRPTVAGQLSFSIPRGENTGVIVLPTTLKTEFSESSLPKVPSLPIELKKLKAITTTTMVFPALKMKPLSLNHVVNRIFLRIGR